MDKLRYTLVSDGSSDAALIPILHWLLKQNGVSCPIQAEWADLGRLSLPDRPTLSDKIQFSLDAYPCDLLFVHRDAETATREKRVQEINKAVAGLPEFSFPVVCVIPIRMQEAWLLIDETAIKSAAGNSRYANQLGLPPVNRLEQLPDPKAFLHEKLKQASDLNKRRRRRYPVARYARRVPEFIRDFSLLRQLSAFVALEKELIRAIQSNNWQL